LKSLKELAHDAIETVNSGYYKNFKDERANDGHARKSVVDALAFARGAIVPELKFASPSTGEIANKSQAISRIASEMQAGGAAAISVLTEPKNYLGSLSNLVQARDCTQLPIIMEDIVVSKEQIMTASRLGASGIVFVEELFSMGLAKDGLTLSDAVMLAKVKALDAIVEVHTERGLREALETGCDILAINNRDLHTFDISLDTTIDVLEAIERLPRKSIVMSESGFEDPEELMHLIKNLRAKRLKVPEAFVIGTSIMQSRNIRGKVRSFVEATL
jgi:indole-3-glycerol phosphate synthase